MVSFGTRSSLRTPSWGSTPTYDLLQELERVEQEELVLGEALDLLDRRLATVT
jgi:hypothetical protein